MTHDPFLRYNIDPLADASLNPAILAEYVTTMGMIKPRGKTGLQKRSQRKIAKAIKRARVSWRSHDLLFSGRELPLVAARRSGSDGLTLPRFRRAWAWLLTSASPSLATTRRSSCNAFVLSHTTRPFVRGPLRAASREIVRDPCCSRQSCWTLEQDSTGVRLRETVD